MHSGRVFAGKYRPGARLGWQFVRMTALYSLEALDLQDIKLLLNTAKSVEYVPCPSLSTAEGMQCSSDVVCVMNCFEL